jgi:hypothetical protein
MPPSMPKPMRTVRTSALTDPRFSLHPVSAALLSAVLLAACTATAPTAPGAGAPTGAGTTPPAGPAAQVRPSPAAGAASAPGRGAARGVVASGPAPAGAPAATAAAPATGAAGAAPVRPGGDPTAPRPFADVIKDAKQQDGFLAVWRKDERVWLEIPKERIGQPFLFTWNVSNALGERGLYASQMGRDMLVEWRRVGNQLQLIALNTQFRATSAGDRLATEQAFSPSLVLSGPVASAEHPERKSVLFEPSALLGDITGLTTRIEAAFRMSYQPDRGNSNFEATRADRGQTSLTARMHFYTPRLPLPTWMNAPSPSPIPMPMPTPPRTVPDARSFFMTVVYNFRALPDKPMFTRRADPRLGHFTDSYTDMSELRPNPRVHLVNRWRLEKKDPQAEVSEPVQPITFWLDRNIPPRYRKAVEEGVLEWNKAFDRIGFRQAIVARQQPDDANWDNMDATHASIRWFVGSDVGFAIGPSHTDPRTGEILDADIGMSDVFARGSRRFIVEDRGLTSEDRLAQLASAWGAGRRGEQSCSYAREAAAQMDFALDLLEARGSLDPDSPQAEAFVHAVIKDTIMHEVGHVLGLKHNFKASTTVTREQLQDKAYTDTRGISGSVMDYNAYNIPLRGEREATFNNTTLGAYDYWAIEYAYKPIDPAREAEELGRIAARSTEPALAYADDADAGGMGSDGLDPLANRFDLGDDPLAYYQKRLALSKELWARVQARQPTAGEDPQRQRRSLLSGFRQLRDLPALAAKYVGGLHTVRDLPGSGRPGYRPVDPTRQREALRFLGREVFSVDSFSFRPEFLASLSPDYNEWDRGGPVSIPAIVLQLQTQALDRLMSAGTAQRVLELPLMVPAGQTKDLLSLSEVYETLQKAVWSELPAGQEIDRMRRNLQREHLRRVQSLLTRGSPTLPPDALSLVRMHAGTLKADLERAVKAGKGSVETRAHLMDSLAGLTEALRATMVRM